MASQTCFHLSTHLLALEKSMDSFFTAPVSGVCQCYVICGDRSHTTLFFKEIFERLVIMSITWNHGANFPRNNG